MGCCELSKGQKRCYFTSMSGLTVSNLKRERCFFVTLTSSRKSKGRNIMLDKQILFKRLSRKYGHSFSYVCVRTCEGLGVLHLVIRGCCFIPRSVLSAMWLDIHGAWSVDIRLMRDSRNLTNYLMQYISGGQSSKFVSFSCSWSWIVRGYARVRDDLKVSCRNFEDPRVNLYSGGYWFPVDFKRFMRRWRVFLYSIVFPNGKPCFYWIIDGGRWLDDGFAVPSMTLLDYGLDVGVS